MLKGTNLKYAFYYNMRITLEIIRLHGPLSRKDISQSTHLTAQTVSNITKKLIKAGLIYESDRQQDGRGAPSRLLKVDSNSAYSIGVDFDKDYLDCVLVNLNGKPIQRISSELNLPTPEHAINLICDNIKQLIQQTGIKKEKLWGVGIGSTGPMVVLEGSDRINAVNPQFFPGWGNVPIVDLLEKKLELHVYLENNASAAAIGERWYGAGKHMNSFFYIFFGAGLGGGLVLNGQLYSGHNGNAGEIGFQPVINSQPIKYRSIGMPHLGMYFDLQLLYKELKQSGHEVNNSFTLEKLFKEGNSVLKEWLKKGSEQLTYSILAIEYILDPQTIFFGGRMPKPIITHIINLIEQNLELHKIPKLKEMPSLKIAMAGKEANALGAATLPFYNSFAPIPSLIQKKSESDSDKISGARNDFF